MERTSLDQTVKLDGATLSPNGIDNPLVLFPIRNSAPSGFSRLFKIDVTAPDGITTKTYNINAF